MADFYEEYTRMDLTKKILKCFNSNTWTYNLNNLNVSCTLFFFFNKYAYKNPPSNDDGLSD